MINDSKTDLRQIFRHHILLIDDVYRKDAEKIITAGILSLPEYENANEVMTYLSFGYEVDTFKICRTILEDKKQLAVPKMSAEEQTMSACQVDTLEHGLIPNRYGILEPENGSHRKVDPFEIDLVIVPGIAFASDGTRLGRGGGHFDRFLADIRPDALKVGICFASQRADTLPSDPWDQPVDCIVTEKEIRRIKGRNNPAACHSGSCYKIETSH
mgnify:CR=1 FL=1